MLHMLPLSWMPLALLFEKPCLLFMRTRSLCLSSTASSQRYPWLHNSRNMTKRYRERFVRHANEEAARRDAEDQELESDDGDGM